MNEPYLKVPVSELVECAKHGIEYIANSNAEKWNKRINKEMTKNPQTGWFWNKRRMTRDEVELYLGKPEQGINPKFASVYYTIFEATKQVQDYKNFIEVHKTDPAKEITLTVRSYNALMTFGE